MNCRPPYARRGTVYLMVLATTTVIATLVSGAVYAQTQRLRTERASSDASRARFASESGIEVVRAWIAQDPSWRTNHTSGRWASNLPLGPAKVDLDVIDTVDGVLATNPYHGVRITSTARVGDAEQIMTANLVARPNPMDALAYAIHTAGNLHVESAGRLIIGSATASTNGSLNNQSTIEGNARCKTASTAGTVYGTATSGAPAITLPTSASADAVALLGTPITIDNNKKIDSLTFSPTSDPDGAINSNGVYVIRVSNDVELKSVNVVGTLVIYTSSHTVTIDKTVSITPSRSDLPALVIEGNLDLEPDSGSLNGLVHATGTFKTNGNATMSGLVLAGSTASSNAVDINGSQTLTYDPGLFSYAPVGYAKSVDMVLQPGSYQRAVK